MNSNNDQSLDSSSSHPSTISQVMGPTPLLASMKSLGGDIIFDGKNYFAWKHKLDVVLRMMGLKEVSSGVELDGAKDLELSDLLTLTVSSSILNSLRSCLGSGQAMMARLESEYNRKDVGSKYAVLAQLLSYRYKGLGIRKHCDDVIQLMNELSDKGVTLDSDIMVCILLYSMKFCTFVTTVSGQTNRDVD